MNKIEVVAAVIFYQEDIFVARRPPEDALAGLWEFPGGKIHVGESEEQALLRELDEEFGMKVEITKKFGDFPFQDQNVVINLHVFLCKLLSFPIYLRAHDQVAWLLPKEMKQIQFAPADIAVCKALLE